MLNHMLPKKTGSFVKMRVNLSIWSETQGPPFVKGSSHYSKSDISFDSLVRKDPFAARGSLFSRVLQKGLNAILWSRHAWF